MKRVVALSLCLIMAVLSLASCGGSIAVDAEDKGDIFNAYITGDMFSFDPGKDFTDEDASKVLGMIYEGLFRLNDDGKLENALAKSVKVIEDDTKGEYKMQINLKETKWSDGNALTADDFVYAWKRIMKSNYESTASALLYDVKNARAVKAGDVSVDELGVSAPSTYMLEITFEGKIDYDNFKKNLASLALVPLRETAVTEDVNNWARRHATLVTNGPFAIKSINREEGTMRIERNVYYYRDTLEDKLDRYVNPYRINVTFIKDTDADISDGQDVYPDNLDAIYEKYVAGEVLYMGDVPLSKRAELEKNAHVTDANSTYSYLFNTENELLSDYRVRQALSMAIDRQAIAEAVVYAEPATGLIAKTVFNATSGKTYRTVHGDILNVAGDIDGAKALLKEAGVKGGSLTLKYRQNEVEQVIAEAVATAWGDLGFDVTLIPLTATIEKVTVNSSKVDYYSDSVQVAYETGDFDILAVDVCMLSTDAFPALAVYATELSGGGIDMDDPNYAFIPHVTGFSDAGYDEIIDRALAEKDVAKRADILFEAEQYLMDKMPVMPVLFNQNCYLAQDIKGLDTSYLGYSDFVDVSYPDYVYVSEEELAAMTAEQ
ncbi:MAG: peptide ABC transporter substrate-binding protein [Clostridia bacterium]|nr:peptide ABC transporter substrate-binding protein [Clostridia bacterium]